MITSDQPFPGSPDDMLQRLMLFEAELAEARAYIKNSDAFREAVKLACDERLQESKHKIRELTASVAAAVEAERAACEKIAREQHMRSDVKPFMYGYNQAAMEIADAIEARKTEK